jgi:hypothetical protein
MKTFQRVGVVILLYVLSVFSNDSLFLSAPSTFEQINAGTAPWKRHIVDVRYSVCSIFPENAEFLLAQKIDRTQIQNTQGAKTIMTVTAYKNGKSVFCDSAWALRDTADAGEIQDNYYKTTRAGIGGMDDVSKLYDLKTGKKLVIFTKMCTLYFQSVMDDYFVTYQSVMAAETCPWNDKVTAPCKLGVLTLSTKGTIVDRVYVSSTTQIAGFSPKMTITYNGDEAKVMEIAVTADVKGKLVVSGCAIKLVYTSRENETVELPIVNSRFDVKNTVGPRNIVFLTEPKAGK